MLISPVSLSLPPEVMNTNPPPSASLELFPADNLIAPAAPRVDFPVDKMRLPEPSVPFVAPEENIKLPDDFTEAIPDRMDTFPEVKLPWPDSILK